MEELLVLLFRQLLEVVDLARQIRMKEDPTQQHCCARPTCSQVVNTTQIVQHCEAEIDRRNTIHQAIRRESRHDHRPIRPVADPCFRCSIKVTLEAFLEGGEPFRGRGKLSRIEQLCSHSDKPLTLLLGEAQMHKLLEFSVGLQRKILQILLESGLGFNGFRLGQPT